MTFKPIRSRGEQHRIGEDKGPLLAFEHVAKSMESCAR